jgi:membrane protease YdiL (CAAX protease family)
MDRVLAAGLLAAALALVVHGWWSGRSLAARIALAVRGGSMSRPRATLGWAAGIGIMYGATSIVALALLGRLDALAVLPAELRNAGRALGIAPVLIRDLREVALPIGAGFLGGAMLVVLVVRRGWRIGPRYRSPAVAGTGAEVGAALVLSTAAGVAEEVFFRLTVPLLAAIVFGSAVGGCALGWALFTLAHRYQGRGGMLAVALVGAALGWLYLATGALWIVVALHAIVDANALVVRPWLERRFAA